MQRLKLASTLIILGLGMWVGPSAVVLAQSPGLTSAQQASEMAKADLLNQQVIQLYEQGKYNEAVPLAEEALEIRKRILGDRHLGVTNSLNYLALLYERQGRYEKAEPLYLRALELYKSLLGEDCI
jgi:tetratricopeptide (TPR) repeat protein